MENLTLIPCVDPKNPVESAKQYNHTGADAIGYYEEHASIETVKAIKEVIDVPLYVGGGIEDLEDVKKVLYAGADKICLGKAVLVDKEIVKKASDRFGKSQVIVSVNLGETEDLTGFAKEMERLGAGELLILAENGYAKNAGQIENLKNEVSLPIMVSVAEKEATAKTAKAVQAQSLAITGGEEFSVLDLKKQCREQGINVLTLQSPISFDEFKLNSDGMLTTVVQDYKTGEVLMVAYMTKEAFEQTVETGVMTYYSRSREELWVKGDTSGQSQYVKSLSMDCDRDTNYLFDKGIDKILKKVGEECTEIVIAAKNPDPEEMKYEISDFLYHLMVLMAERGMTWEQVTQELMERK